MDITQYRAAVLAVSLLAAWCRPDPDLPRPTSSGGSPLPSAVGLRLSNATGHSLASIEPSIRGSDPVIFIDNETYIDDPDQLLGSIVTLNTDENRVCPTDWNNHVKIVINRVQNIDFTKGSEGASVSEYVINRGGALSSSFLGFISGRLDEISVFSVALRREYSKQVNSNQRFTTAISKFHALPENEILLLRQDWCQLFVVMGIAHYVATAKKYTAVDGGVGGGAYGIQADGRYYSSDSQQEIHHMFAARVQSWLVRSDLPRLSTGSASTASSDGGIALADASVSNSLAVTHRQLEDWIGLERQAIAFTNPSSQVLTQFNGQRFGPHPSMNQATISLPVPRDLTPQEKASLERVVTVTR